MAKSVEHSASFEADLKTPLQRFDRLARGIKPFIMDGQMMGTGAGTTPLLPTEAGKTHFLIFKPGRISGHKTLYSPSILWQQFPKRKFKGSGFLIPKSEIYVRRSRLKSGSGIENLDELEAALEEYDAAAQSLSLENIERLSFPKSFLRREALRRGEGMALANLSLRQTLKIVES